VSNSFETLMRDLRVRKPNITASRRKKSDRKRFNMKSRVERKWDDMMKDDVVMDRDFTIASNQYYLAAASLNDHHITKLVAERIAKGLSTITVKENFVCEPKVWFDFIHTKYVNEQIIEFTETNGMIINNANLEFIDYSVSSNSVEIKLYGSKEYTDATHKELTDLFTVASCHIEWVYGSDGSSVNIPMMGEKLPISEMYPFLDDETVEQYYDRYLNSDASILLLIGPPGTGKTTFIRGLLHYAKKNAIVTYDEKILERDYVFARFIEDDVGVMVIEDADNFLKSRSEGNTMMHRFLNVGDGLISLRGKKLVFSTNLPSVRDIDAALIRPGRCFDIVTFDNYTYDQAKKLADKMNLSFEKKEEDQTYSLAEVFHKQRNSNPKQSQKMGFV
jgi:hypothetical protein